MEELLPIWKFCVEPSFPHSVEVLRFLGASSSACSVWVITPNLAINSCFSFCNGAQGREWWCIHNLLWHCNISTKMWNKIKLAFQLQLCVPDECNERQHLWSASAVWRQLCCKSKKNSPAPAESRLIMSTTYSAQERRGAPVLCGWDFAKIHKNWKGSKSCHFYTRLTFSVVYIVIK